MGVVVGDWRFADRRPPTLSAVASALQAATGLEVSVTDDGELLEIVLLRLRLFDPYVEEHLFSIRSLDPHPYLWENLDRVMIGFGGVCDAAPRRWRPDPADAALRSRWDALPSGDRRRLAPWL